MLILGIVKLLIKRLWTKVVVMKQALQSSSEVYQYYPNAQKYQQSKHSPICRLHVLKAEFAFVQQDGPSVECSISKFTKVLYPPSVEFV